MKSKKVLAGILALAFVFGGTALPTYFGGCDTAVTASADQFTKDGIIYTVLSDHAEAVGTKKGEVPSNVTILSSVDGLPVTKVLNINSKDIVSLTIPDSVTYIGTAAFAGNENMTSVKLGNNVEYLGQEAFSGCTNLPEIVIPDGVTKLNWTFPECTKLKKVVIGNGVEEITGSTFFKCTSLTEVVFGRNVKKIGSHAFYYCTSLTEIKIPDSVTSLGDNIFSYCTNLKKAELGNNIATLPGYAFLGCKSLEEVKLPGRLEKIENDAFNQCTSLKELVIPKGTKELDFEFLANCSDITLEIPASVNKINDYAFQNAKNVTVKCYDDTPIREYIDNYNSGSPSEPINVISLGAAPSLLGDVNNDGNIDIEDAVMVINHVNGVKALTDDEVTRADVDGNSDIDIEDAVAIISHVNGVKSIN